MIQNIAPYKLDNSFKACEAQENSVCFTFRKGKLLGKREKDGFRIPVLKELSGGDTEELRKKAIYIFSVQDEPMFLLPDEAYQGELPENMEYTELRSLYEEEKWKLLAGVTASHLNHWYKEHRYCGCCGTETGFSEKERAKICPKCGNIQYPRISPVIMAAVTDGERLLVTRYAGRPYKGLALIAGFVEIGESLEEALCREVMEEVGLKIGRLRYFGSQPWGFSDSVISGFFARLEGSSSVRLDRDELAEAVWLTRDEIPPQNTGVSITSEMIEAFRTGGIEI